MIDIDALKQDKRPQSSTIVHALIDRLEAAEADALEQARLNGMGSEREAALMAKLEAAEKERDALRVENETLAANLRGKHSTAGATYAHLIAERDALRAALQHEADCVEAAKAEIKALRAKIAEMERQEPVAKVESWTNGSYTRHYKLKWLRDVGEGAALYALPGAQPAPNVPEGWKLVPIEPTLEMLRALIDGANQYDSWNEGYRDMIAAAPGAGS